jgi:hypothetical protein
MVFWGASRGSEFTLTTDSFYVNDSWRLNDHWSFNLGARYESTTNSGSDDIDVVDVDSIAPRLAVGYDVRGDGRYRFDASYAEYSGAYNMALFTNAVSTANPDVLYGPYLGPAGQGDDFAPGFDPDNYDLYIASSGSQNRRFAPGASTPIVEEYTLSAGMELPRAGYLKASYISREHTDLLEDFITREQGTTTIEVGGVSALTDRVEYRNTDAVGREYEALVLQGRYRLSDRWDLQGHWTHQLRNHGNYEGESGQTISPSSFGDYPELFDAERHYPFGRLDDFQENRIRLWTTYLQPLGRFGHLTLALLGNYDSGLTYSLQRANVGRTPTQTALANAAGYAAPPGLQTIFFGERGSEEFDDSYTFDLAASYSVDVFGGLEPWIKLDVRNVLNDDTQINGSTTIVPVTSPGAPRDALGLPTTFTRPATFGTARNSNDYVIPREFRVSVGIRF